MPLSVEYTKNLLNKIFSNESLSEEDANLFVSTPTKERFYLAKSLLAEIETGIAFKQPSAFARNAYNIFASIGYALTDFKEASYNDFYYLFTHAPASVLSSFIIHNKNIPVEFFIEDKYYERLKSDPLSDSINSDRKDFIEAKQHEVVPYLRNKFRDIDPGLDSVNDKMILSIAGVSI